MFAFSTHALHPYTEPEYRMDDALLFGPETRGLPAEILGNVPREQRLRLPLRPGNRSLNLSNAVAVAVYEAWRQLGFAGAK
jgi:tRNA (cytidine/uridine-2'-O-)-methyltransferase